MYDGKRILGLIPARGGSKGIPDKNLVDLHGKPLIAHRIASALKSRYIDRTIVSTDSETIAETARRFGADVPFLRPEELALDTSKTIEAVLHAVRTLEASGDRFDVLLLLQPTQPLTTAQDMEAAIELFFRKGQKGLVSVSPVEENPLLMRTINENAELVSLLGVNSTCRRQDMPEYYKVNGCIYINRIDELTERTSFNDNPVGFVMERSHSVDIDEPKDLALAEYFLDRRTEQKRRERKASYYAGAKNA